MKYWALTMLQQLIHHYVAQCDECSYQDDDYMTAEQTSHEHAAKTGHSVTIEIGATLKRAAK